MWRHIQHLRDYQSSYSRTAQIPRPPEPPTPPMSIIRFLGLSFLVNTPVYFFIYAFSSLFLVQYILLPAPLRSFITYIRDFLLPPIIGLLATVSIILPFLFIAFMTSHISSFIQAFLDTPIGKTQFPSPSNYRPETPALSPEPPLAFTTFTPLSILTLFHSFLTSVLNVIQNPSCLLCFLKVIFSIWSFVRSYLDPYAYVFLYQLPERIAHLALCLIMEPWRATQLLAELVRGVLVLIGIPVNEFGKGVSWIGRMLAKMGGGGHLMGVQQNRDEGLVDGVLLIVGYLMLDWMKGLVLSTLKDFVVSALVIPFSWL